ncbi:hypothetical protein Bca52824_037156 [Brassica carinata]|uniref:Fibronectin type III-like domain-containing protein n=1 Tax=Brassica carinata TaxID=52824 RepID=A0A8X7SAX3_BRACI|nr:hypothetical protein Bca52824_037156 [Brassica carinata]
MSYLRQTRGNRALFSVSTLLLSIIFFISKPSNAQSSSSPDFACDVTRNPSLAGYGFCNTGLKAEARVADLVGRLTLEEKIGFLVSKATGVSRLGIPDYNWWSEALHGVSDVGGGSNFTGPVPGATSFPQVILTAASFNISLFQAIGKVHCFDCDSVEVMYASQHYTKTPEEAMAKSMLAGLDLNCDHFTGQHAMGAVKAGFFNGDPKKQPYGNLGPQDVCTADNQELAREAARQGIVLLKNSNGSLPFSPSVIKTLAVIGPNANVTDTMIGNYHGLVETVSATYQLGCPNVACTEADIDSATSLAASADAVVLVMGTDLSIEREDHDRVDLLLPGKQQQLVTEVAKVAKGPVVLVIMSGGGLDVTFAKNDPKIASIMWVGFPGQAGGLAIADIIFGRYNPSGNLPMTWYPQSYVENLPMSNMNMRSDNSTGYPGRTYRFYSGETVYAFGDGISYTHFNHHLIKAPRLVFLGLDKSHPCRTSKCQSVDAIGPYCGKVVEVQLRVKNAGNREGSHTVFLFMTPPAVHRSPVKHLLAFEKVRLGKKEKTVVRFTVDVCKDLSVVDETGKRKIALGEHVLHVGNLKYSLNVRI